MLNLLYFATNKDLRISDVEAPYYAYQKNGNRNIIRYLFMIIRYYDSHPSKKYKEIPKLAFKAIKEITFPFLTPLLYEKVIKYSFTKGFYILLANSTF